MHYGLKHGLKQESIDPYENGCTGFNFKPGLITIF
jgi:hypothetical protein